MKMDNNLRAIPTIKNIGRYSFDMTPGNERIRKKRGIDTNRIKTDKAFERTRQNWAEFKRAALGGKLVRRAFSPLLKNIECGKVASKLLKEMMKVIKSDSVNGRGMRNLIDGQISLLEGFDFNPNRPLGMTFLGQYEIISDRSSGKLTVVIARFAPSEVISVVPGATHFRIVSSGTELDFEKEKYVTDISTSDFIPMIETQVVKNVLVNTLPPGSLHPLLVALGVEFYQELNKKMYLLHSGAYNVLAIVKTYNE
jgi:hypothetical protein